MNFKYHLRGRESLELLCVYLHLCATKCCCNLQIERASSKLDVFFLNWKGCLLVLNSPGRLHCPLNCPLTFTPYPETLLVRSTHCSFLTPALAFLYLWCECESVTVVNVMPPPGQIYNNNNNTGRSLPPAPASPLPSLLSVSLNHFYFSANF